MRTMGNTLQAAKPEVVKAEHLPTLPAWWPPPPKPTEDDPQPRRLEPIERNQARYARAMTEARRGPLDGQRGEVAFTQQPPEVLWFADGGWAYRLDHDDSTKDWLVYRYSPADSPAHVNTMAQVEAAFREMGADYVTAAVTDQAEHHGINVERIS